MQSLRIQGVVRLADGVRRELSRPITAARKDQLRRSVTHALSRIDEILADHTTQIHVLPEPTRRAYEFLKNLDLDAVVPVAAGDTQEAVLNSIRFTGLQRDLEHRLDRLATALDAQSWESVYEWARGVSDHIERQIEQSKLGPGHLTTETRAVRGWLTYFSRRTNFDAYLAALGRGRPIIEDAVRTLAKYTLPVLLHFRTIAGVYRVRRFGNGTRVILPTPMICLSAELFTDLSRHLVGGGSRQRLLEAMGGEEYQAIQAELDVLGGVEQHVEGMHHDLAQSFDRVNLAYFSGSMVRPRLAWSRTFTGRKFGHYDLIRDAVMMSSTLDRDDVPEFVLDSVMYHELLHKQLGADWRDGRMAVHTAEFRRQEQRFERFVEAEAILKKIANADAVGCP